MDSTHRTDAETARFAAWRMRRLMALGVFASALVLALSIVTIAILRPDLVFRTPLIAFLPLAALWLFLTRTALRDWQATWRDMTEGGVETVTGPARLRQDGRPGLLAGLRDRLLVGDRVFRIDAELAETIVPGRDVRVRYAPRSGALLSIAGTGAAVPEPSPEIAADLTRREQKLLGLIAEGMTDKEIARRLNLSPATVRTYNSALYQKLGVTSRTQAIRIAKSDG